MAEAGPSNAVVAAAEPEVDLSIHPSGIVPQLQVTAAGCWHPQQGCKLLPWPLFRHAVSA